MSIESSLLDITILKCHISNDPLFLDMQRGECTFFCEIAIIDLKVHAGFLYKGLPGLLYIKNGFYIDKIRLKAL